MILISFLFYLWGAGLKLEEFVGNTAPCIPLLRLDSSNCETGSALISRAAHQFQRHCGRLAAFRPAFTLPTFWTVS